MAKEYIYKPLCSPCNIRVVTILPNAQREAPLRCHFEEVSLDAKGPAKPRYDALSYVWGARTGTLPLECDGKIVLITPNCEDAMRYLRHTKMPVVVWIDAICINQGDFDERAQQVPLMGAIYQGAGEVIVWYGVGNKKINHAFSRMKTFPHLCESEIFAGHAGILPRFLANFIFSMLAGKMNSQDYIELVSNPWMTRIWTAQELVLASKPVVMYGSTKVSWKTLYGWVRLMIPLIGKINNRAAPFIMIPTERFDNRNILIDEFQRLQKPRSPAGLSPREKGSVVATAVQMSQNNQCTNPLDKIYGIYALVTENVGGLPKVDYHTNKLELYESFTKASLRMTEKFWLAALGHRPQISEEVPSWIPNLETQISSLSPTEAVGRRTVEPTWCATLDSRVDPKTLDKSKEGTIALKGKAFSKISAKAARWPSFSDRLMSASSDAQMFQLGFECVDCFIDWLKFVRGGSLQEKASVETLCDLKAVILGNLGEANSWEKSWRFTQAVTWIPSFMVWYLSVLSDNQEEVRRMLRDDFRSNAKRGRFVEEIAGEHDGFTLFSTSENHFGKSVGDIHVEDSIVLLSGSDWPVVLRPVGENYRYVGRAYVQGIMGGSAWSDDIKMEELESFVIV